MSKRKLLIRTIRLISWVTVLSVGAYVTDARPQCSASELEIWMGTNQVERPRIGVGQRLSVGDDVMDDEERLIPSSAPFQPGSGDDSRAIELDSLTPSKSHAPATLLEDEWQSVTEMTTQPNAESTESIGTNPWVLRPLPPACRPPREQLAEGGRAVGEWQNSEPAPSLSIDAPPVFYRSQNPRRLIIKSGDVRTASLNTDLPLPTKPPRAMRASGTGEPIWPVRSIPPQADVQANSIAPAPHDTSILAEASRFADSEARTPAKTASPQEEMPADRTAPAADDSSTSAEASGFADSEAPVPSETAAETKSVKPCQGSSPQRENIAAFEEEQPASSDRKSSPQATTSSSPPENVGLQVDHASDSGAAAQTPQVARETQFQTPPQVIYQAPPQVIYQAPPQVIYQAPPQVIYQAPPQVIYQTLPAPYTAAPPSGYPMPQQSAQPPVPGIPQASYPYPNNQVAGNRGGTSNGGLPPQETSGSGRWMAIILLILAGVVCIYSLRWIQLGKVYEELQVWLSRLLATRDSLPKREQISEQKPELTEEALIAHVIADNVKLRRQVAEAGP